MISGLAERLRDATRALHRQVERAGIMPALLRGELPAPSYCRLLRNLHGIYEALELALERHATLPAIAPLVDRELFRTRPLEADLHALHGVDWPALSVTGATRDYVGRLRTIERDAPARLVAHAYVRYLGDLSGGQILRRVLAEALELRSDVGLRFYSLGDPGAVACRAARLRDGLGSAALAPHAEAIVDEAQFAFRLHARLFEELATAAGAVVSRPA
ncbi:MAG: biliverdin-producing heme oxygenase [Caldimonas sp.]